MDGAAKCGQFGLASWVEPVRGSPSASDVPWCESACYPREKTARIGPASRSGRAMSRIRDAAESKHGANAVTAPVTGRLEFETSVSVSRRHSDSGKLLVERRTRHAQKLRGLRCVMVARLHRRT